MQPSADASAMHDTGARDKGRPAPRRERRPGPRLRLMALPCVCLATAVVASGASAASLRARSSIVSSSLATLSSSASAADGLENSRGSASSTAFRLLAQRFLDGQGRSRAERAQLQRLQVERARSMSIRTLVREFGSKLGGAPSQAFVSLAQRGEVAASTLAVEVEKALKTVNELIVQAWGRLDRMSVECAQTQAMHDDRQQEAAADVARLADRLASFKGLRDAAVNGLQEAEDEMTELKHRREQQIIARKAQEATDSAAELARVEDVKVAKSLEKSTRCKGTKLLQTGGNSSAARPQLCTSSGTGSLYLHLDNAPVSFASAQTMDDMLRRMLRRTESSELGKDLVSLLQQGSVVGRVAGGDDDEEVSTLEFGTGEDDDQPGKAGDPPGQSKKDKGGETTTAASSTTTAAALRPATTSTMPEAVEVALRPPGRADDRCVTPKDSACGAMHLSSMKLLGEAEEGLDEVRARRFSDSEAHEEFLRRLNIQLTLLHETKWQLNGQMSEATAKMNTVQELMRRAEQELRDAELQARRHRQQCTKGVEEILGHELCGLRALRAAAAGQSGSPVKPDDIVDCEVSDWTDGECSVSCDNQCTHSGRACGGVRKGMRSVLQAANTYGAKCPPLERVVPCNQVRCPVDCELSEWSGWSSCTRACDGGVRQRTRSVLREPKHAGDACDAATETQPCHSGACSRECALDEWSEWSGCSAQCGGGVQQRTKAVLAPAHGVDGTCPADRDERRLEFRKCNQQACAGDEVCVDMQDLVVLVDSSADISEAANKAQFHFLEEMLKRYRGGAFGRSAARIGVVHFGNGELNDDGSVTKPVTVSPLTMDLESLRERVSSAAGTNFQGFSNLVQAMDVAEGLCEAGRTKDGRAPYAPASATCKCPGQFKEIATAEFGGTVEGCAASCTNTEDCRAFVFQVKNKGCTLHKELCPMGTEGCGSGGKVDDPNSQRPFNRPPGADPRDAPCSMLILTGSGKPPFTAAARRKARKLWAQQTRTLVVAFSGGGRGDEDLRDIASEPTQTSYLRVQGYGALASDMKMFAVDSCPGLGSRRSRFLDSKCEATVQSACGAVTAASRCCDDTSCEAISSADQCPVLTAEKAKEACKAKNMRLCTPKELEAGKCCTDKCTERLTWSSMEASVHDTLNELMTKVCPDLQSPSLLSQEEKQDRPWRMIRKSSRCHKDKSGAAIDFSVAESHRVSRKEGPLVEVCARMAREKKWEFFGIGKELHKGLCYKEVACDPLGFRPAYVDYYRLLPKAAASASNITR